MLHGNQTVSILIKPNIFFLYSRSIVHENRAVSIFIESNIFFFILDWSYMKRNSKCVEMIMHIKNSRLINRYAV